MIELKRLSPEAIPAALEKAHHYRLLNEPTEAQSICLDVLEVDPENQRALVLLLLAWTDRFDRGGGRFYSMAREIVPRLDSAYARAYYEGIVLERWAKAKLRRGGVGASAGFHDQLRQAMASFERAADLRPAGEDEALLRWNTCARLLESERETAHAAFDPQDLMLE